MIDCKLHPTNDVIGFKIPRGVGGITSTAVEKRVQFAVARLWF